MMGLIKRILISICEMNEGGYIVGNGLYLNNVARCDGQDS